MTDPQPTAQNIAGKAISRASEARSGEEGALRVRRALISVSHKTGIADVTVTTPDGTSANTAADDYTYNAEGTCQGQSPTVAGTTGTPGDDVIIGTAGDDVIYGKAGNDIIALGAATTRCSPAPVTTQCWVATKRQDRRRRRERFALRRGR